MASTSGFQHAKVAIDCLQSFHSHEMRSEYQWRSAMRRWLGDFVAYRTVCRKHRARGCQPLLVHATGPNKVQKRVVLHQFLYWLEAAYTAKEDDVAVLARSPVYVACTVRNHQFDDKTISIGPASELSADHTNVQMLGMPAAAFCRCESPQPVVRGHAECYRLRCL